MLNHISAARPVRSPRDTQDVVPKRALCRDEFRRNLEIERARTDRSEKPFSLILLEGRSLGCEDFSRLMDRLFTRLRMIDQIGWFDERRLGVVLPYTGATGALAVANDIRHFGWPRKLVLTIYTYPGQWLPDDEHSGESGDGVDSDAVEVFTGSIDRILRNRIPAWKRAIDILVSISALVLLSPLFAVLALTIAIVSPGPIFHRQKRIGYQGRSFTIWKFRTMKVDADIGIHQEHFKILMTRDMPLTKLDMKGDPRIIPLGNFMRRCYLDELPQLFNVLRGDMSLVGPRPCLGFAVSQYLPWQRMRCDVAPGMTGLWQVSGKNKTTFTEMIRLDIAYVKRRSVALDIKIVLRTFPAIFKELIEAIGGPAS
jgi:lipopolysaccharide/colanic/teichoic acid biosynthesis glycosyltransferase